MFCHLKLSLRAYGGGGPVVHHLFNHPTVFTRWFPCTGSLAGCVRGLSILSCGKTHVCESQKSLFLQLDMLDIRTKFFFCGEPTIVQSYVFTFSPVAGLVPTGRASGHLWRNVRQPGILFFWLLNNSSENELICPRTNENCHRTN